MIRPFEISLNAAHPELPLAEAVTYQNSPSAAFIHGVPPAIGAWRITSVYVAVLYPDGTDTTVTAALAANGVYVTTLPATATSGRSANGLRFLADGVSESGETVTGYVLGVADFAVVSLEISPAPAPGQTAHTMRFFDSVPSPAHEGDVAVVNNVISYYDGTAWQSFGSGVEVIDPAEATDPGYAADALATKLALAGKANDADVLKNSGNQTLDGSLMVTNNSILGDAIADFFNNATGFRVLPNGIYKFRNGVLVDTLALLSDIYAAAQQIAPAFEVRDSAHAYAKNDLCTKDGVVYQCTASGGHYGAWNANNWTAKKVSELFLPLTGGTVSGEISANSLNVASCQITSVKGGAGLMIGKANSSDKLIFWAPEDGGMQRIATLTSLAPKYSTSATYAVNDLCVYSNNLYCCTTAIETAEAWTVAHWTEATVEDVLAAIRAALADKAPLASPAFTGTPTAPTAAAGDNSTKVATTAFVQTAVSGATPNLDYVMCVNPETGEIYYTTPDTQNANA